MAANSTNSQTTTDTPNPCIFIAVAVAVVVVALTVSATIYLLLRCLRRSSPPPPLPQTTSDDTNRTSNSLIDSLPLFTFSSLTGSISNADCAVCLSKFDPRDQLRLLPVCCHAFHADCIDSWLSSNHTCPLCRSSILLSEAEILSKISAERSFRVEIGRVFSSRRDSESLSLEYILNDAQSEVTVDSSSVRGRSELIGEKSGRSGNWLREHVDGFVRTASFSVPPSFRGSGRLFVGSSRRTDVDRVDREVDLEASRFGGEIEAVFRWLSAV